MAPARRPFSPQMKQWVMMVVSGASRREIIEQVFHVDFDHDTTGVNRADQTMHRWRCHPDYEKEWKAAYREVWGKITVQAMKELRSGLEDKDLPWRRTQHVNLALTYGTKLAQGEDANTVKVQITGMPELGTPDQDE